MGHDSTVKTRNLLSIEQFKLNVIGDTFETMEEREFKAMTSDLERGTSMGGQGRSRKGRWQDRRVGGNEMHTQRDNCIGEDVGIGTRPVFTTRHLHVFGKVISNAGVHFFSKVGILPSMLPGC